MPVSDYEPRFDPAAEWDRYCERQEQIYQALITEKTCEDCSNCVVPDKCYDNPGRIGYCRDIGEFVSLDDSPKKLDCERFEE